MQRQRVSYAQLREGRSPPLRLDFVLAVRLHPSVCIHPSAWTKSFASIHVVEERVQRQKSGLDSASIRPQRGEVDWTSASPLREWCHLQRKGGSTMSSAQRCRSPLCPVHYVDGVICNAKAVRLCRNRKVERCNTDVLISAENLSPGGEKNIFKNFENISIFLWSHFT
jgi:hypothetical protein